MTTQTTTTFIGVVGRNENLFRETKSGDSAGGNQAIISDVARIPRIPGFSLVKICKNGSTFPRLRFGRLCQPFSLPIYQLFILWTCIPSCPLEALLSFKIAVPCPCCDALSLPTTLLVYLELGKNSSRLSAGHIIYILFYCHYYLTALVNQ